MKQIQRDPGLLPGEGNSINHRHQARDIYMKMTATCSLVMALLVPTIGNAIVLRHDMAKGNYAADYPGYLIDMPHEGHGVLIAPDWIVTVAHTVFYDYRGLSLRIAGQEYVIADVIFHPDYRALPENLPGDGPALADLLVDRSDLALIRLSTPVSNRIPIAMYPKSDERGMIVEIYGKGATGDGRTGERPETKNDQVMRVCRNRLSAAEGNWLAYQFDQEPMALPLEGMHGSGDSGGPVVVNVGSKPHLVGLSSWQRWDGKLVDFKGGLYGTTAHMVRVSAYRDWILSVIDQL